MKKNIIIAVVAFVFGMATMTGSQTETVKVKEVEKRVEVVKNEKEWKELKAVDDKIIVSASNTMNYCSQGFYAVSEFDLVKLESLTEKVNANTVEMSDLGDKRLAILDKLGY